jgi:hypothetical protein
MFLGCRLKELAVVLEAARSNFAVGVTDSIAAALARCSDSEVPIVFV